MQKIKIGIKKEHKKIEHQKICLPSKIQLTKSQISKSFASSQENINASSQENIKNHIKEYFLEPLKELINNDGVSKGYLIASVDALKIMKKILKSILKQNKVSIIDILEKAAFADCEHEEPIEDTAEAEAEVEDPIEKIAIKSKPKIEKYFTKDENEDDCDSDNDEEEFCENEPEQEEDGYDDDIEAARECDFYNYEEDESMDG